MNIKPYTDEISDELMALLLAADPDKKTVEAYLTGATVWLAKDQGSAIGIAVLVIEGGRYELINISVHESHQGKGVAKQLIAAIKAEAKKLGAGCLYVGTGNSSLSQLALYQKCEFRMDHIKKDFFLVYPEEIWENGIRCVDKAVLCAEL